MVSPLITERQWDILKSVLAPYADRIDRVGVFGSRATGKARANSDIDLVIYGSATAEDVNRLRTLFSDSSLEVGVDIAAYHLIAHPPFKAHIDQIGQTLFTRSDLTAGIA